MRRNNNSSNNSPRGGGGLGWPSPPPPNNNNNNNKRPRRMAAAADENFASPPYRQQQQQQHMLSRQQQQQHQSRAMPSTIRQRRSSRRRGSLGGGNSFPATLQIETTQQQNKATTSTPTPPRRGTGGIATTNSNNRSTDKTISAATSSPFPPPPPPPPSGSSGSGGSNNELLIRRLSQCCRHHYEKCHHNNKKKNDENDENDSSIIPTSCYDALISMSKVLLIVENDNNNNNNSDSASVDSNMNIQHLCEFYKHVCTGNFCPYGIHLFHILSNANDASNVAGNTDTGNKNRGAVNQVLRRIHLLFKHLLLISSSSSSSSSTSSSQSQQQHDNSSYDTWIDTTARLVQVSLSLLANTNTGPGGAGSSSGGGAGGTNKEEEKESVTSSSTSTKILQSCILNDLVSLAMDTCVFMEAIATTRGNGHTTTTTTTTSGVTLELWPTYISSLSSNDENHHGENGETSNAIQSSSQFLLELSPTSSTILLRQLKMLQMVVVGTLYRVFDKIIRHHRHVALLLLLDSSDTINNESITTMMNNDLIANDDDAPIPFIRLDGNSSNLLFAVLRYILISNNNNSHNNHDNTNKNSNNSAAVTMKTKLYALRMLSLIIADDNNTNDNGIDAAAAPGNYQQSQDGSGSSSIVIFPFFCFDDGNNSSNVHRALVLARAAQQHLKQQQSSTATTTGTAEDQNEPLLAYTSHLVSLLSQQLCLEEPSSYSSSSSSSVRQSRFAVLKDLWDTVPYFDDTAAGGRNSTRQQQELIRLKSVILRGMWVCLQQQQQEAAAAAQTISSLLTMTPIHIRNLVRLLEDTTHQSLSLPAAGIVSFILLHHHHPYDDNDPPSSSSSSLYNLRRVYSCLLAARKSTTAAEEAAATSSNTRGGNSNGKRNGNKNSATTNGGNNRAPKRPKTTTTTTTPQVGEDHNINSSSSVSSSFASPSSSSFEESLAAFFMRAMESANELTTTMTVVRATDASYSDTVSNNISRVSSATQILASILLLGDKKNTNIMRDSNNDDAFHELALALIESLIGVLQQQHQRSSPPTLGTIVACGSCVYRLLLMRRQQQQRATSSLTDGTMDHQEQAVVERKMQSFVEATKQTYITFQQQQRQGPKTNASFLCSATLYYLSMLSNHNSGNGLIIIPVCFGLFPEVIISLSSTSSTTDGNDPLAPCKFFLLQGMNGDETIQRSRLDFFKRQRSHQYVPREPSSDDTSSAAISLQNDSFHAITMMTTRFDFHHDDDPPVRIIKWQCLAWLFLVTTPTELRRMVVTMGRTYTTNSRTRREEEEDSANRGRNFGQDLITWFLAVAFADTCPAIRDYASREIGGPLLSNHGEAVIAFLATDEEWDRICDDNNYDSERRLSASGNVISRLFRIIDHFLEEHCSCSQQSQLSSFTSGGGTSDEIIDTILAFQKSAVRALVSMCNLPTTMISSSNQDQERMFFEESLKRIFCLSNGPPTAERFERSGICLGELSVLKKRINIAGVFGEHCLCTLAPALFRTLLIPSTGVTVASPRSDVDTCPLGQRETQFLLLCAFIKRFLIITQQQQDHNNNIIMTPRLLAESNVLDVEHFIELSLPSAVSRFIVEEDYDVLKLSTGFKLFVLYLKRTGHRLRVRSAPRNAPADIVLGHPKISESRRSQSTRPWSVDLEKETCKLCSGKAFPDRILPLIFMYAGRSQLTFFSRTVLQSLHPLKRIMENRGQLILKQLVKELGRTRDSNRALRAIKAAALARSDDPMAITATSSSSSSSSQTGTVPGHEAATEWVTSQFMYLLVNCIQSKWSSKSASERVYALRCLSAMLGFLRPSESAQYLPQIMSTVNVSIDEDVEKLDNQQELRCELRLRAVQVLATFLKLVPKGKKGDEWKPITQNLTNIVVSLIPVLSDGNEETRLFSQRALFYLNQSKSASVALLEWLTQGKLGKTLAPHFHFIPFLPTSPALDTVRSSLHTFGVDFDNLQVVPTAASQGSQHESIGRDGSIASDFSTSTEGQTQNARRQAALRRRLGMLCSLLSNENVSIRRVALQHLTALLQANRELFHLLVANEGAVSMKRYLTVIKANAPIADLGTVTDLVETLLARCVNETDPETRVLLGKCFGEVGAIDSHRLEETKGSVPEGAAGGNLDAWRLMHPPWLTDRDKYELQLVTKHLVGALKAAPTSSEQHKVAFSIQQLLVMLNTSKGATACNSSPPSMQDGLKHDLSEAGVFDVVEPFWYSQFRELGGISMRQSQPPFFVNSSDYNQWMTLFCSYMIHRSKDGHGSVWSELFYACRTSVRTPAGLSVAEFLLPLLILDRLCFGNAQDERVLLQEIQDALSFEAASVNTQMDWTDRQKAVSISFAVVETLELWGEQDIERRYRQKSRHGKDTNDTPESDWPLDDAVMRIEDFSKAIPLPLRARAAAKIGMNARALRLLEMTSRKTVAEPVFDSVGSTTPGDGESSWKRSRSRAAGNCPHSELNLMKDVLASLHDYETVSSLDDYKYRSDPKTSVRDTIRQKEATGDWEGALQGYERAQQLLGSGGGSGAGEYHGQNNNNNPAYLQCGALRCLLELGHFESALNQVNGIMRFSNDSSQHAVALGAEAAWRLGRWDTLSDLVCGETAEGHSSSSTSLVDKDEVQYQLSVGRLMLGIKEKDTNAISIELKNSRSALMVGLSSSARESYSRAYDHIVRLQALNEIGDTATLLTSPSANNTVQLGEYVTSSLGWDRRLSVSSNGASSIIKTRLALSRLAGDTAYEGALFVNLGRRARKKGLHNIAANSFSQAEAAFFSVPNCNTSPAAHSSINTGIMEIRSALQIQVAKLKHDSGESNVALRMLGLENIELLADLAPDKLRVEAKSYVREVVLLQQQHQQEDFEIDEDRMVDIFAKRALQTTRWMVDGSLKDTSEIKGRFQVIHKVSPSWEKGHFQYAKYVDSLFESRLSALFQRRSSSSSAPQQTNQQQSTAGGANANVIGAEDEEAIRTQSLKNDILCQDHLITAMKHYAEALSIDTKHVYQALPRLLSLWFDLTSIKTGSSFEESDVNDSNRNTIRGNACLARARAAWNHLKAKQEDANVVMAKQVKQIPPQAYYTAIPQLIARVTLSQNNNKDTAMVVRGILKRVLVKFPGQALWQLGWLRKSKDAERKKAGDSLFKESQKQLRDLGNSNYKILVASESLFTYLQSLAKYSVPNDTVTVREWRGEVDLSEFIPPIQAALSVSMLSATGSSSDTGHRVCAGGDIFPRQVPRMRRFSQKIGVMPSKAKPKKLKAYAVAHPNSALSGRELVEQRRGDTQNDLGEIHFLVKQEARGDLRKDARVQDFNNVVNRLISSSSPTTGGGHGGDRGGGGSSGNCNNNRGDYRLHLRTFAVTCLSEDTGILEWVPNTNSLRNIVMHTYNPQAAQVSSKRRGTRMGLFDTNMRRIYEGGCQEMYFKNGDLKKAAQLFEKSILLAHPPVLFWWFVHHFQDPHAWYEARTRFTQSSAAWSAVGHVIGLGDRHSENILINTATGECVHVDFDCIFDKGLHLPKPETVPFRLTQNMLDAFGPAGADGGVYSSSFQAALSTLRCNRDTLLSVLEPFIKDPVIDWKRQKASMKQQQQQQKQNSKKGAQQQRQQQREEDRHTKEAKRSIKVIDERLQGIFNFQNPNYKKIRRTDGGESGMLMYNDPSQLNTDNAAHYVRLSVEGQVQKLVAEATSSENLVQLYSGWMPWL